VDIKVTGFRTFGLKADGKIVFAGLSEYEEEEFVKLLDNVVEIATNKKQLMTLDSNGNISISKHPEGISILNLEKWTKIKHILTFGEEFIGLKEDGTIVTTFANETEFEKWTGIKYIEVNDIYVAGKRVKFSD